MTIGRPFFGIGAMRAGTSWLYHVLSRHSDCGFPPLKELHFFDTKYGLGGGDRWYMNRGHQLAMAAKGVANNIVDVVDRFAPEGRVAAAEESSHDNLRWDDELRRMVLKRAKLTAGLDKVRSLLDYFAIVDTDTYVAYLKRHGEGAQAYGEITPAYALLPAEAFAEIDRLFPDAIYIFIMRDPIDRLWSQVRYSAGKAEKTGGKKHSEDPNVTFASALKRGHLSRSLYQSSIETLESVVPRERILYLFFERTVSPESGPREIARIEDALGLRPINIAEQTFRESRNASAKAKLSAENEREGLRALAPTYRYIEKRFGAVDGWRRPLNELAAARPTREAGAVE